MKKNKPIANPAVVLREEPDNWAILFNPETNNIYTLDPVAVFIWKHLDGEHTEKDIVKTLNNNGIVGMLSDQDAGANGVFVNFFECILILLGKKVLLL